MPVLFTHDVDRSEPCFAFKQCRLSTAQWDSSHYFSLIGPVPQLIPFCAEKGDMLFWRGWNGGTGAASDTATAGLLGSGSDRHGHSALTRMHRWVGGIAETCSTPALQSCTPRAVELGGISSHQSVRMQIVRGQVPHAKDRTTPVAGWRQ